VLVSHRPFCEHRECPDVCRDPSLKAADVGHSGQMAFSSTAGDEADGQSAAAVYRARVSEVDNGRLFTAIANLVDLTISPFYPDAWPEPRFHVLIGRDGVDHEIGVATARTKRRAREALARVQQVLATSTAAQARTILDLDF
jgi:hypothetical protein